MAVNYSYMPNPVDWALILAEVLILLLERERVRERETVLLLPLCSRCCQGVCVFVSSSWYWISWLKSLAFAFKNASATGYIKTSVVW